MQFVVTLERQKSSCASKAMCSCVDVLVLSMPTLFHRAQRLSFSLLLSSLIAPVYYTITAPVLFSHWLKQKNLGFKQFLALVHAWTIPLLCPVANVHGITVLFVNLFDLST